MHRVVDTIEFRQHEAIRRASNIGMVVSTSRAMKPSCSSLIRIAGRETSNASANGSDHGLHHIVLLAPPIAAGIAPPQGRRCGQEGPSPVLQLADLEPFRSDQPLPVRGHRPPRHEQRRRERIRLQLDPRALLAGPADDRGASGLLEQTGLQPLRQGQLAMQLPVADLMAECEAIAGEDEGCSSGARVWSTMTSPESIESAPRTSGAPSLVRRSSKPR